MADADTRLVVERTADALLVIAETRDGQRSGVGLTSRAAALTLVGKVMAAAGISHVFVADGRVVDLDPPRDRAGEW